MAGLPASGSKSSSEYNAKNTLLQNLHCFSLGKIIEICDDTTYNIKIQEGYKCKNNSQIFDQQIVKCLTLNLKNFTSKYEVGDIVAIAYTDKPVSDFLTQDIINFMDTNSCGLCHNQTWNGIILFPIKAFDSTQNGAVKIEDDTSIIQLADGEIKADNGNGSIIVNDDGKLSLSNSAGGDLLSILTTALETYIKGLTITSPVGPSTIDDSAVKSTYEEEVKKLLK